MKWIPSSPRIRCHISDPDELLIFLLFHPKLKAETCKFPAIQGGSASWQALLDGRAPVTETAGGASGSTAGLVRVLGRDPRIDDPLPEPWSPPHLRSGPSTVNQAVRSRPANQAPSPERTKAGGCGGCGLLPPSVPPCDAAGHSQLLRPHKAPPSP